MSAPSHSLLESSSAMSQRIIPPLLEPGSTISIIAPAGIADRQKLEEGMAYLRSLGFGIKTYRDVFSRHAIFAGDDAARAGELIQAFADPDTQAIVAARGGYGCIRLLPYLDVSPIAARPKVFLGYSDNTVLHAALWHRCGLVTFHGPHVSDMGAAAGGMASTTATALWRMLMIDGGCPLPAGDPSLAGSTISAPPSTLDEPLRMIAPGVARAPVVGGNLALVCALLGTDDQIDTRGKIVFLEDVDEPPYRIDRCLKQLSLAGCFDEVSGVLLGSFTRCDAVAQTWTTTDVLTEHFQAAAYPVLAGYPAGHGDVNLTFPLGVGALT